MYLRHGYSYLHRLRGRRGVTLMELMVAVGLMGILAYSTSMIYFSVLNIYTKQIWKLPPYDAATAAVQRVSKEIREAMQIDSHGSTYLVVVMPQKSSDRENVLTLGEDGNYHLTQGDYVRYYLSNATGSLDATGNCLWKAVKPQGTEVFTPKVKIADNIHPELNPVNADTGSPHAMFKYWPDETRLWGVETWMTSTEVVHGQAKTQSAHSESYLRNL